MHIYASGASASLQEPQSEVIYSRVDALTAFGVACLPLVDAFVEAAAPLSTRNFLDACLLGCHRDNPFSFHRPLPLCTNTRCNNVY